MNDSVEKMLMPILEQNVNKNTTNKFIKDVTDYIDYNNQILTNSLPLYRLLFNENKRDKLFDIFNINKHNMKILRNTIDSDKKVTKPIMYELISTPFNIVSAALIKHYTLKKDDKSLNFAIINLAFSFYSVIHPKYYRYLPNPDIMEYTLNRVTTKFTFKQQKTILNSIRHIAVTNHNAMVKSLLNDGDSGILFYLTSLNSRINNIMKTFCEEYMKDYEAKNAVFSQADNTDSDNFILTSNLSGTIQSKAQTAITDFFTTKTNEQAARLAAKFGEVDQNMIIQAVGLLKKRKGREMQEVITNILISYLNDPANSEGSLGSQKFVVYSLNLFRKSNVKIPSIIRTKELLDQLLDECVPKYHATTRDATKQGYKKAIYCYLVLTMQTSIK